MQELKQHFQEKYNKCKSDIDNFKENLLKNGYTIVDDKIVPIEKKEKSTNEYNFHVILFQETPFESYGYFDVLRDTYKIDISSTSQLDDYIKNKDIESLTKLIQQMLITEESQEELMNEEIDFYLNMFKSMFDNLIYDHIFENEEIVKVEIIDEDVYIDLKSDSINLNGKILISKNKDFSKATSKRICWDKYIADNNTFNKNAQYKCKKGEL